MTKLADDLLSKIKIVSPDIGKLSDEDLITLYSGLHEEYMAAQKEKEEEEEEDEKKEKPAYSRNSLEPAQPSKPASSVQISRKSITNSEGRTWEITEEILRS